MAAQDGFRGVDETDPVGPSGHAYGIRVSSRLTSDYRTRVRRLTMDVTPQEVIDCVRQAGIKNWVLMGLHGYVGYLPMPRATQDVDVMVPYSEKARAAKAIAIRWPSLLRRDLSQVVRFLDPEDKDHEGKPKPVIDLMLPWSPFQETILRHHVVTDPQTGNRHPTVEAAIVSKYAPLVSPFRSIEKKAYDAGDLRRIIRANHDRIDRDVIRELGNQVWDQGGEELLTFLDLAMEDKPFPV